MGRLLLIKYRCKQAIKEAAHGAADRSMNDDLFHYLCQKDQIGFWKSWRKRFCAGNVKLTTTLNSKQGDIEILREYTEYYKLEKVALDGSVECCAPPPR